MALVPAICTQCGAQIEVDNTHEAGICKHCGTAFVTEKAINKYTTYITNNNNFAGANINMNVVSELEQLVSAAEGFQRLEEYEQAHKTYETITQKFPQDPRGWIGCISTVKKGDFFLEEPLGWDVEFIEKEPFARWFKNAWLLSDENMKKHLENTKKAYVDTINAKLKNFEKGCSLQALKKFIGNDIYACTYNYGFSREWFYVLNGKIYYLTCSTNEDNYSYYGVYEVTSMDSTGNMHAESCYNYSDKCIEKNLKLRYFHESTIVLYYEYMFNKTESIEAKESIEEAWRYAKNRQTRWESEKNHKQNNGCYIATCVYGSYDCPQVWTLRRFRDYTLDETWYGRIFIKCYYAISPTLVKWFGNQKWFRLFWRKNLDNMVSNLKKQGITDTPYNDKY